MSSIPCEGRGKVERRFQRGERERAGGTSRIRVPPAQGRKEGGQRKLKRGERTREGGGARPFALEHRNGSNSCLQSERERETERDRGIRSERVVRWSPHRASCFPLNLLFTRSFPGLLDRSSLVALGQTVGRCGQPPKSPAVDAGGGKKARKKNWSTGCSVGVYSTKAC